MRTLRLRVLGLTALIVVSILGLLSVFSAGTSAADASGGGVRSAPNHGAVISAPPPRRVPVSRPVGGPAITPHMPRATPSYDAADAAQYVTTHRMWRNLASGLPSVVRVQFLTSRQVSILLGGESTGQPDDAVLCYVELQGRFVFPDPSGTTRTYTKGVEVFDGQTGNLLIAGGLV